MSILGEVQMYVGVKRLEQAKDGVTLKWKTVARTNCNDLTGIPGTPEAFIVKFGKGARDEQQLETLKEKLRKLEEKIKQKSV
jgi:hypothetical protein